MEMYNLYFPELPVGTVSAIRIPCYCEACDKNIQMDWIKLKFNNQKLELIPPEEQPRFANVVGCKYKNIHGEDKKWYILTLTLDKEKGVPVDINEYCI